MRRSWSSKEHPFAPPQGCTVDLRQRITGCCVGVHLLALAVPRQYADALITQRGQARPLEKMSRDGGGP